MVDGTLAHRSMNGEINLHATTDASVWAFEFLNVIKKEGIHLLLDKDCLHTWFANAIMTGCDHTASARDKQYIYILKSHTGELVKIFDYEPGDADMDEAYAKYLREEDDLVPGTASMNCVLYRWRKMDVYLKDQPIEVWNGKNTNVSKYNWK
jgi:hypothetical protein